MEMKGWEELGVVSTIYEEEDEEDDESFNSLSHASSSCAILTPSPPPPPPQSSSSSSSFQSMVKKWSRASGSKTDVLVRVHDKYFHLHREVLVAQSGYFRRHLTESSAVTVSPPSTMTAETFAEVACFCYGGGVALTLGNLAAVRVAAGWLEMANTRGGEAAAGLVRLAEEYFEREVAADAWRAAAVLRSCLRFLLSGTEEEAEVAAEVAAGCAEALGGAEDGDGRWVEDVESLPTAEFGRVARAMRARLVDDHDLLYRMVDGYLHNHDGKLTEEEKNRICYNINCTKLSHSLLMHLVQNPRLPLRFVVQAMLVEQLHTRRCILDRAATATATVPPHHRRGSSRSSHAAAGAEEQQLTLGAILQRDAARRRSADLRAAMEATSERIRSLERDLAGLRQRLRWSDEKKAEMETARSASFRTVRYPGVGTTEGGPPAVVEASCDGSTARGGRGFGRRLVRGLRSMFKKWETTEEADDSSTGSAGPGGGGDGDGADGEAERTWLGHRRNGSFG